MLGMWCICGTHYMPSAYTSLMAETSTPGDDSDDEGDAAQNDATASSASGGVMAAATPTRSRRQRRPFPQTSFEEALFLGRAIQEHGAGQPIRRLTLFEALKRAPDSGPTRKLITASNQYGITKGAYNAETLALTQLGATASDPTAAPSTQLAAKAELAINGIAPFKAIYEQYKDSRVPSPAVLRDAAIAADVPDDEADECVETFLANARDLNLIRNIGGSEHLIAIEAAVDEISTKGGQGPAAKPAPPVVANTAIAADPVAVVKADGPRRSDARDSLAAVTTDLDKVCFVLSPIGEEGSEYRKHADLVLSSLIEPALAQLDLKAVRADKISVPGMITGQIMEHIARAKLVIADLSFGNPNVYYELALRHAVRKPFVQLIRTADKLPFDVGQYRTVTIDMTDIYSLVPQLDLHRQEIARQSRAAIADGALNESPISRFYPSYWGQISTP